MGHSSRHGGYFSGSLSPQELRKQVAAAEELAKDEAFEAAVSHLLDSALADTRPRNPETLRAHISTLESTLQADIEGTIDMRFGGSIAKRTYVDGLSDADALVVLNKSELAALPPEQVRSYLAARVRERLPNTTVREGDLAVTVEFADIEVQLIPAVRAGKAIHIPDSGGKRWSGALRPDIFASQLRTTNQTLNGKVIPTIKLAKAILSRLPDPQRLSGYHVEALALAVFQGYQGPLTTKTMLRHFLTQAPLLIRQPMKDTTGQSVYVDDYLGGPASVERRMTADAVARIGRGIVNADISKSVDQWTDLLG
jgi:hypothetical protein